MSSSEGGHKRIAKNTLFMYIRLLVTMPVAFITSRLILNELGVSDYGIYNAVAGIVMLFSTLRAAFASATQRFYNVSIGKKDNRVSEIFTTSFVIHLIIALILICVLEVFGHWFINNEMNYPIERRDVVLFLFQMIVLSSTFQVINIPFDAMVIANERMVFYSYVSVIESLLKLAVAYSLLHYHGDKLLMFSISIPCIGALVLISTIIYCRRNFSELKFVRPTEKGLAKELSKFAGWSLVGNLVYSFVNEGVNLLLNVFGGVVANAARGITYQIKNALQQVLVTTFVSVRPQAIQMYVKGELTKFFAIIYTYSKIIYFLGLIMVVPMYFYVEDVLMIWLGQIQPYVVGFIKVMLIHILVRSFHEPLDVIFKASGRIKQYQIISSVVNVLIIPVVWVLLKLSYPLYSVFFVLVFFEVVLWIALVQLATLDGLSVKDYIKYVLIRALVVTICSFICAFFSQLISAHFIVKVLLLVIVNLALIFVLGLSRSEGRSLLSLIKRR